MDCALGVKFKNSLPNPKSLHNKFSIYSKTSMALHLS